MKKTFLLMATVAISLASCTTMSKTATQKNIAGPILSATTAELEVSDQKVTYTLYPTKEVRKGGEQNCINTAISSALKATDGDILVETQKAIVTKKGLLRKKVTSVTVTGYPAKYKKFNSCSHKEVYDAYTSGVLKGDNNVQNPSGFLNIFKK